MPEWRTAVKPTAALVRDTVLAATAIVAIVFSWLSANAARDAARTAREQVALSTIPNLDAVPRRLGGYSFGGPSLVGRPLPGGLRHPVIPRDYKGSLAILKTPGLLGSHRDAATIVFALRNVGAGYAVIRGWRYFMPPGDFTVGKAIRATDLNGFDARIVRPSEVIHTVSTVYGPAAFVRGVERGHSFIAEVYFTDITGERQYDVELTVVRNKNGEWNVTDSSFHLD